MKNLKSPHIQLEKILIATEKPTAPLQFILHLASRRQTTVIYTRKEILEQMARGGLHQNVLATSRTPTPQLPTATPVPPTATPPPSVAIVDGEYITIAEFQAELARYKAAQAARGITVSEEEANKIVLEDMIAQVMLSQAAREANFNLTEPDLKSRVDALAESVGGTEALSAWQSTHGYDDASFRVALKRSAEAAWMRDKIIADVPTTAEQIHVRQILTYNEADAQSALQDLNAGADFDELASQYDPVTNATSQEPGYTIRVSRFTALGFTCSDFLVHAFDLAERADIDGLIGLDYLKQFNYEVRSADGRILVERV